MEQQINSPENPEEKLRNFRGEIRSIVEEEQRTKETGHFQELNPEELSPEDMEIWEKVKNKSITREDFDRYRNSMLDRDFKKRQENLSQSRVEFLKFVSNRASIIFLEREIGGKAPKD